MQKIIFRAMGSQILIALDTNDQQLIDQAWKAQNWFKEWEQIFSRFRLNSELSTINRHPGIPYIVSETMMEVLKISLRIQKQTDGMINPLILNSLESSGYDLSFDELEPNNDRYLNMESHPINYANAEVEIIEKNKSIIIPPGYKIDLGGVVKGWAAKKTLSRLQPLAPALVDAGGDIAISESLKGNHPWLIGITNPFYPEENLGVLKLSKGGVATSGRDFRRWKFNGQWMHHLIDVRTGFPAQTDIISATVFGDDIIKVEALAKCAVILGSEAAINWLSYQYGIEYLLVLEDESMVKSNNLSEYIVK